MIRVCRTACSIFMVLWFSSHCRWVTYSSSVVLERICMDWYQLYCSAVVYGIDMHGPLRVVAR